jgi:hypothetical protein
MFAKGITFYEKYGFKNNHYLYARFKDVPYEDLVEKDPVLGNLYEVNMLIYNEMLDTEPDWNDRLIRAIHALKKREATIGTVSQWFFLLCMLKHRLMEKHTFLRNRFEDALVTIVREIRHARDYEKPISNLYYTYSIDISSDPVTIYIKYLYKTNTRLCKPL